MFQPQDKLTDAQTRDLPKTMRRCKRCRTATCKGSVKDADAGTWVYWCGWRMNGWHAAPCEHYGK